MSVLRLQFKLAFSQVSHFRMWIIGLGFAIIFSFTLFFLIFTTHYKNRFYQGVFLGDYPLGGLTALEAEKLILDQLKPDENTLTIILQASTQQGDITEKQLTYSQVVEEPQLSLALQEAFSLGRMGNFFARTLDILKLVKEEKTIILRYQVKLDALQLAVKELADEINIEGKPPTAHLTQANNPHALQIDSGENGWKLAEDLAITQLSEELSLIVNSSETYQPLSEIKLVVPTQLIKMQLNDQELEQARNRMQNFIGSSIKLVPQPDEKAKETSVLLAGANRIINDQQLIEFLNIAEGVQTELISQFAQTLAQEIDQPSQNAQFEYNLDTLRATSFKPHQPGLSIDQDKLVQDLVATIEGIENTKEITIEDAQAPHDNNPQQQIFLVIRQTEPEFTLSKTNDLGINELIGFGESHYRGSIAPRVHNIKIASDKLNMALVPPGETFSLNKVVGKVDGSTGFQQAYVIRSGSTLMEFGGGVCQVSTTMFRAMLDSGVNITKRLPHSYRVRYYELDNQPGFDATVYSGEVDLRFVNDTPGYLLILAEADSAVAYMSVKIYGTSDGRRSEISGYRQWDYASPPPSQDIPDPSLASGQRKQVENAVPGIKTSFDWKVYDRDGGILHEKTFFSHYRAWGAKYLVGI